MKLSYNHGRGGPLGQWFIAKTSYDTQDKGGKHQNNDESPYNIYIR
jgi:hypothetical protein